MKNNPFISDVFVTFWQKHFVQGRLGIQCSFIKNLTFFKPNILPLYINTGKNLTKGVSYVLNDAISNDFAKKVFLVYDVPSYFNVQTKIKNQKLRLHKVKQYSGFLIHLKNYSNFESYISTVFSKNSRQKINRFKRRLELCFDITYKMYFGKISEEEYDNVFRSFRILLIKRFQDKQITNNNLDPKEWNFYHKVVYPMIVERKASLYVIYNGETPISIRLNYYSDNTIFDAITVFDIDFNKFHIGKVSLMKILEWAFKNHYETFDFSKGYYDYKESWSDLKYDFEYHIYYDSHSIVSSAFAKLIQLFYKNKQYLREKNIHEHLHRITYVLASKASKPIPKFTVIDIPEELRNDTTVMEKTCIEKHSFLRPIVFEFLFLNSEYHRDVTLFISKDQPHTYFIIGNKIRKQITVSKY